MALGLGSAPARAADGCPNDALRAQSNLDPLSGNPFSLLLPDCRAYEQVTPPVKAGLNAGLSPQAWVSQDGNTIAYYAWGAFAGAQANGGSPINAYIARRTASGWQTRPLVIPASISPKTTSLPLAVSPDTGKALLQGAVSVVNSNSGDTTETRLYIQQGDGSLVQVGPDMPAGRSPAFFGKTPDFSTLVFIDTARWGLGAGDTGTGQGLYVITGAGSSSPEAHRVDVDNSGNRLSGTGISNPPTRDQYHLVSDNASVVYFCAGSGDCGTLYARHLADDGTGTTTTIASGVTQLLAGSADGTRVIFTSSQQLVAGDTDATADLYEYDARNPVGDRLVQLSAGGATGAKVLGLLRSSDDATRTYFVATGVLTGTPNARGQSAQAGADNLYLNERTRDTGGTVHTHTTFVGLLCSGANASGSVAYPGCGGSDSRLWATGPNRMVQANVPDARYLLLSSFARLTPDDTDSSQDIYRYDAVSGELTRVSRAVGGFGTNGNGALNAAIPAPSFAKGLGSAPQVYAERLRALSDDGSVVVFETNEQLTAADDNNALDVYRWQADPTAPGGGTVALISSGQDNNTPFTSLSAPAFVDSSGRNVFFVAGDPFVSQDIDNGLRDIYVARVDGGFPAVVPSKSCAGDGCQGPLTPRLGVSLAGSVGFVGAGNVPVPPATVPVSKTDRLRVKKPKTVHGTSTRIAVKVPVRGRLRTSGSGLRRSSRTVKRSGATYRVAVRLSKRARRTLARKHRLKVRVTVRLTPRKGKALRVRVSVTFRVASAKKQGRS